MKKFMDWVSAHYGYNLLTEQRVEIPFITSYCAEDMATEVRRRYPELVVTVKDVVDGYDVIVTP